MPLCVSQCQESERINQPCRVHVDQNSVFAQNMSSCTITYVLLLLPGFKIMTLVTGQFPETSELNLKCYCWFFPYFFSHSLNSSSVYCFNCYLVHCAVCSSSVILWRLGDVPVITCGSLSLRGEENVPDSCFCCNSDRVRRSRLVFIPRTARWVLDGCRRASSTCDEHAARTVWHSGGGVPGRLSSGFVSHRSAVNSSTAVAPSIDW